MRSSKSLEIAVHRSPTEPLSDRQLVHLWLLDLDARIGSRSLAPLTSDEREKMARLKGVLLRRRTARRFALARLVLSGVMGVPPDRVGFTYGVCGKPRVVASAGRPGGDGMSFNLSHSENVLAMVVGFGVETGVDVEVVDHETGTFEFYRDWTLREAAAKLVGTGIAIRNGVRAPRSMATGSVTESFAGKEVVLGVAVSEPSDLPDLHQGVFAKDSLLL